VDRGGLQLWGQPTGARLWRVAYRFAGKQKLLALGVYPSVSLAKARQARDEAKRLLAQGLDPSNERKQRAQAKANAPTFRALADEYLAKLKREARADATLNKTRIALQLLALLFPAPGSFGWQVGASSTWSVQFGAYPPRE
jgi:Arm DNA-binding domain